MKKVVVLIPAYNEGERIEETLRSLESLPQLTKIVVINDGSQDLTKEIVQGLTQKNPKLSLVHLEKNLGKGGALNSGLTNCEADVYLFLDGDLTSSASLAHNLLEPVLEGRTDMTIACFAPVQTRGKKGMGFGLVRRFASLGVYTFTGEWIKSPLSGQRAFTAELLQSVKPIFPGFGVEIGLTVGALHHGFQISEIPVAMHHRGYGRGWTGIKHRSSQLVHVIQALWLCKKRGWY